MSDSFRWEWSQCALMGLCFCVNFWLKMCDKEICCSPRSCSPILKMLLSQFLFRTFKFPYQQISSELRNDLLKQWINSTFSRINKVFVASGCTLTLIYEQKVLDWTNNLTVKFNHAVSPETHPVLLLSKCLIIEGGPLRFNIMEEFSLVSVVMGRQSAGRSTQEAWVKNKQGTSPLSFPFSPCGSFSFLLSFSPVRW